MRPILLAILLGCALAASVERERRRATPKPETEKESVWDLLDEDGSSSKAKRRVRRSTCVAPKLWPGGEACYVFDSSFSDDTMRTSLRNAMDFIERVSCVKFTEGKDNCPGDVEATTITQVSSSGCWAHMGCSEVSDAMQVNVPDQCDRYGFGVVLHEILHMLGRYHEHARGNRDDYVTIITENIKPGKEHNFDICEPTNYSVAYDYLSVMHYAHNSFSKSPSLSTIEPVDDDYLNKIGKQLTLSPRDVVTINKMYNCYASDVDPYACKHGGAKKDDGICYCVGVYTGDDCGDTISDVESFVYSGTPIEVKSPGYPSNYPANTETKYSLECEDESLKVKLEFVDFDVEPWGCGYDKFKYSNTAGDIVPLVACGTTLQDQTVTADDSAIYMEFKSDDLYQYGGFSITFTCV